MYAVTQSDLVGLIENNGITVLNIEFESINKIHNNLFVCKKGNELFLFDARTEVLKKL